MANEQKTNAVGSPSSNNAYSPYILWLIWIVWIPFIFPPIVQLIQSHTQPLLLITMFVCVVFFLCTYAWATLQNARALVALEPEQISNPKWLSIALLIILSLLLIWSGTGKGYGNAWFGMFIFTSAYIAGRLPTFQALLAVVAITLLTLIAGILVHLRPFDAGQSVIFVFVVGIVTISFTRAVVTGQKLRAARKEIAQLAITTERLRIARDLHDLLGHNLSLIALKSELAGRLIAVAPERAANEIRDVENVARTTLQEVREAVAAYLQPTVVNELLAAQEILAAANIAYRFEGNEALLEFLPSNIDAALAWMVREGITNVIKHSRAHQCTIRLIADEIQIGVEIIDDGTTFDAHTTVAGNGLRGLAERVAALHGTYESGVHNKSGFRLSASIPLTQNVQETRRIETSMERSEWA